MHENGIDSTCFLSPIPPLLPRRGSFSLSHTHTLLGLLSLWPFREMLLFFRHMACSPSTVIISISPKEPDRKSARETCFTMLVCRSRMKEEERAREGEERREKGAYSNAPSYVSLRLS